MVKTSSLYLLPILGVIPSVLSSWADTLHIYDNATLGNVSASNDCLSALTANVTCYANLGDAVTQVNAWSAGALNLMCADSCKESLNDYVSSVDMACGTLKYNISGIEQVASLAGQEMVWKQMATCLKDPSSGEYCNRVFQESADGSNGPCSNCTLDYLSTLANSGWGQKLVAQSMVASRISSCSATASYTVTSTPSLSLSLPLTSATPTTTATNSRCNTSDPNALLYRVHGNASCSAISRAKKVSTPALKDMNALGASCSYLHANQTLCLPSKCAIHRVMKNDTCSSIINSLDHEISSATFRSWNPAINVDCSNLNSFVNDYLCVRYVSRL